MRTEIIEILAVTKKKPQQSIFFRIIDMNWSN